MTDQETHRALAVTCFNEVWSLLDRTDRSADDDRRMREMAHASLFHWLERDDVTPTNLSIGLWQVARVHAVLGEGATALRYAEECLHVSADLEPFYLGYAHEAVARAQRVLGDADAARHHVEQARTLLPSIDDAESRALLEPDLDSLA